MKLLTSSIVIFCLCLGLSSCAFFNETCTTNANCTAEAPLCLNKRCARCQIDFDCFDLNMYYCQSGKCQDCTADFECQYADSQSLASNKTFCDTRYDHYLCSSDPDHTEFNCTSNRDCGSLRMAECDLDLNICGPCTNNVSCQTFGKKYCVRGACLDTFTYPKIANCSKYDGIGYCKEC